MLADVDSQIKISVRHVEVWANFYAAMVVRGASTSCASNRLYESTSCQRKRRGIASAVKRTGSVEVLTKMSGLLILQVKERSPSPKDKDPRPIPLTFKNMCKRTDDENPTVFRLPQDIRQFFAGSEFRLIILSSLPTRPACCTLALRWQA